MTEPRTILYVSNTRYPWCTEVHVTASLRALGHTVINLQENELRWGDVPGLVDKYDAHMLLWTRTWVSEMGEVAPILDRLREARVPSVSYHLDRWFGLGREGQVRDQPFFRTDLVVTPDDSPRWADEGVNHLWMPPGVFDAECGTVAAEPRRYPWDVVFVGSYPYPHPEWEPYRRGLIETFQRRFGDRFAVLPKPRQPLRGARLQALYASVPVILGDSCLAGESHMYWSDRIPETLGRGGYLIHPYVEGGVGPVPLSDWYISGEDLHDYPLHEFEMAADIADAALSNLQMRDQIAEQGRRTVLGRDTYRLRMAALLEEVGRQFGWRDREYAIVRNGKGEMIQRLDVTPEPGSSPVTAARNNALFDQGGGD